MEGRVNCHPSQAATCYPYWVGSEVMSETMRDPKRDPMPMRDVTCACQCCYASPFFSLSCKALSRASRATPSALTFHPESITACTSQAMYQQESFRDGMQNSASFYFTER